MSHAGASTRPARPAPSSETRSGTDDALARLLRALRSRGYRFVTPSNRTYRILRRRQPEARARTLRDVFGWSLPFAPGTIDAEIEELMAEAGIAVAAAGGRRSALRVSSVDDLLFLHSAYPTGDDAVFLGPDSYRFASLLRDELALRPAIGRIVDVGAGAGVGGLVAAAHGKPGEVIFTDVNPAALRLARINAAHAGREASTRRTTGLQDLVGPFDLVVANPPFIADGGKLYSDGGGAHGVEMSMLWVQEALPRLAADGRIILYTGAPIVEGHDRLRDELASLCGRSGAELRYREIDPDIFSDQLARPAYADVERIAAVGAIIQRG